MVNKQLYKVSGELKEGPPPMDESWWEAVLAEEKQGVQGSPPPTRNTAKYKNSTIHNQNDTVAVDWKIATELFEQDKASSLRVDGYNRGGLLVSGEGLQGFVPISHLTAMPEDDTEVGQEQFLESYSGKQLQLKIIECDQERGRVVFSEGLIHVSEISWGRVRHPSDVVDYGEKVKVHVINVDPNRSRVALSIKRLHPNPWATAHSRYQSGQVTEATIISIVPFGAFARLEEGLDGLIHVSEMSQAEEPVDPKELLSVGQQVQVQILHVDAANQRLGLSLVLNQ
jgi:small subunit ribosomal protein S1